MHQVMWSGSMERGKDCRWMMHRWNPGNVEKLSPEETKEILGKISDFDKRTKHRDPTFGA
jgi:hypothetical protein